MNKAWSTLCCLVALLAVSYGLGRQPLIGAENVIPCVPSGLATNCVHDAVLHISTNVTISPAAPAGAPYDSIVCVGETITAGGGFLLISNATQQVWQEYTGPNCPSVLLSTTHPAPLAVTLGWSIDDGNGTSNGAGSSVSFTRTNGTGGGVSFSFGQIVMPPDSQCGATVPEGHETAGKSFAFVAVGALNPEGELFNVASNVYLAEVCEGGYVVVEATPEPSIPDEFLPTCWTISGGTAYIEANGITSRTKRRVSLDSTGSHTITATAGSSSKSITIIVYKAVFSIAVNKGNCLADIGHAWWELAVEPSSVHQYLKKSDGTPLSQFLGLAGYFGDCTPMGPGFLLLGQQTVQCGSSAGTPHPQTGGYWWCVSFSDMISALTYVNSLDNNPGTYLWSSNNCVTQSLQVSAAAGVSFNFSGIDPCGLDSALNFLWSEQGPPVCYCF